MGASSPSTAKRPRQRGLKGSAAWNLAPSRKSPLAPFTPTPLASGPPSIVMTAIDGSSATVSSIGFASRRYPAARPTLPEDIEKSLGVRCSVVTATS